MTDLSFVRNPPIESYGLPEREGRNLFPYPDFELGGGFYNNAGASVMEYVTDWRLIGTRSFHVIPGQVGYGYFNAINWVTPGEVSTFSVYILSTTDQTLCLKNYNGGIFDGPAVDLKAYVPQRLTMTQLIPAGATAVWITVNFPGPFVTAPGEFYLDGWQIEYGNEATPLFTGDTEDDDLYSYSWEGAPNASASLRTPKVIESFQYFDEPEVIVEIAWTDNFAEPFPTWTDITDRVEAWSTSLGRSTEIGSIEAGVVNLTLDNSDGAFTAGNAASPYYPNVRPRRQLRVRINDGTDTTEGDLLRNVIPYAAMLGDTTGYEVISNGTVTPPADSYPVTPYASTMLISDLNLEVRALASSTGGRFPCAPGDKLSGTVSIQATGFAPGPNFVWHTGAEFFDSAGTSLGITDGANGSLAYQANVDAHFENLTAPANAASYSPIMYGTGTGNLVYVYNFSAYNHGQTAFDWSILDAAFPDSPGQARFIVGSMATNGEITFAWNGSEFASESVVYVMPPRASVLGRGYVERWPTQFSGLAGEVTVPVVDWQTKFGADSLTPPFLYEIERRTPAEIFRFDDDGTVFYSTDPTRKARTVLAYPESGDVYKVTNSTVPSIAGGGETLLPLALEGSPSARATDQSVIVNGGRTYYLGACLKIDLPRIKADSDSFSFAFIYQIWEALSPDLSPIAFVLKDSRLPAGQGELRYGFSQTGYPGDYVFEFRVYDNGGAIYRNGYSFVKNQANLAGFSWDSDLKTLRLIRTDSDANLLTETNGYLVPDAGGANVRPDAVMAGLEFDSIYLLGYSDRSVIGGFADHAMQMFTRWDYALSAADFLQVAATRDGLIGQTADKRIHAILDNVSWPRQLRRIAASTTEIERAGWERGTKALEWLQSTANDARGLFYVDSDGMVTFRDRHERTKANLRWTFDHDDGTGVESGLLFESADADIVNVAHIDNAYGVTVDIDNQASRDEFGVNEASYSLRLADQEEAIQYGYHVVNRYGQPQIRVSGVMFNPSAQAWGALWGHAKGIAISDKVRLKGLPDTAPAPEMDFFVESIAHDVIRDGGRLKWTVALSLSPAEISDGWVLGDPVRGVLGSTSKLIF